MSWLARLKDEYGGTVLVNPAWVTCVREASDGKCSTVWFSESETDSVVVQGTPDEIFWLLAPPLNLYASCCRVPPLASSSHPGV